MSEEPMVIATCRTAFGWVGIAGRGEFLAGLTLPTCQECETLAALQESYGTSRFEAGVLGDIKRRLQAYFDGEEVSFSDVLLDPTVGTPFQRRVWEATREIPRGETRTYGQLARQSDSPHAARAIGQAMARNPWPIVVPCHRVVGHDGRLTGFGGGLDMKKRMLNLERPESAD
jgi:methylated-DNA-[protein]-cysteine S-methyltransferase